MSTMAEVPKSSPRYTLTSIGRFAKKFDCYVAEPIVLYMSDVKVEDGTIYLPLYMSGLYKYQTNSNQTMRKTAQYCMEGQLCRKFFLLTIKCSIFTAYQKTLEANNSVFN